MVDKKAHLNNIAPKPEKIKRFTPAQFKQFLEELNKIFDYHYLVSEVPQVLSQVQQPKFILRHDVQQSLHQALILAQIEHDQSIRGSFMIDVLSPNFRLDKEESLNIIKEIIRLGHEIGLHINPAGILSEQERITYEEFKLLEEEVGKRSRHLETLTGQKVLSISLPDNIRNIPDRTYFLSGKVSASSAILMGQYISDIASQGAQDITVLVPSFLPKKILQVVIHPQFWID